MSATVSTLRSKFNQCIRQSCEVSNCMLNLSAFPNQKLILDIDCIAKQKNSHVRGKRCDRLIVAEKSGVIFLLPVEFKTTRVIADDVKKQLEGGIRFFKNHHQDQFNCYPVLVSKSLGRQVSRKLQKVSISYNGKKARIKHVFCDQSLSWNKVSN